MRRQLMNRFGNGPLAKKLIKGLLESTSPLRCERICQLLMETSMDMRSLHRRYRHFIELGNDSLPTLLNEFRSTTCPEVFETYVQFLLVHVVHGRRLSEHLMDDQFQPLLAIMDPRHSYLVILLTGYFRIRFGEEAGKDWVDMMSKFVQNYQTKILSGMGFQELWPAAMVLKVIGMASRHERSIMKTIK